MLGNKLSIMIKSEISEGGSHLTTCRIVTIDELNILPPVQWIFTVPNEPLRQQPMSTTIIKASTSADAIPLAVENSPSMQTSGCISFEIYGDTVRENKEVIVRSSRF
jgi:hypothetical protein